MTYDLNDFHARALVGHQSEIRVAKLLRYWGYDVPDPVYELQREGRTRALIEDFGRNQKDLEVMGIYLEVKSRTLSFTSRADYPYQTCLLETVSGYEKKAKKPEVYVVVSQPTGAILCVDARDMKKFAIEEKVDRSRNLKDRWYSAPRVQLRPHTWLEGYLASRCDYATKVV